MTDWLFGLGSRRARRTMMATADAARDANDKARAADLYGAVVRRFPLHKGAWGQCGNMLKDIGRFDDAEQAYESARRLDPQDADIHIQLGHLSKLRGRLDDAIGFYRQAVALDPSREDAAAELASMGMTAVVVDVAPGADPRPDLAVNGAIVHRRLQTAIAARRA